MTYNIRSFPELKANRCNILRNTLNDLDMMNNKHIADIYKVNTRDVRMRILAGLIDSDGHVYYEGKGIEISQKNKKLSDDIQYLCFSLGFMVTRKENKKGCPYKGQMSYGLYQRMQIFGDRIEELQTLLERKITQQRVIDKRATCYSFKVEETGYGQCHEIKLSGDGRYLLEDFTISCCK